MKRILIFTGAGAGIILLLLGILPFLIPSSVYKARIEEAATKALGREVAVAGPARISLLPTISASVENVTVANPDGFEEPFMIEAGALRGSVNIWPLLSRRVDISELSFENASVMLLRRADGEANWTIEPTGPPDKTESPKPADHPFSATVKRASLSNATLVYDDRQEGVRYVLNELDAEATLRDLNKPMTLRANGVFQTERFDFAATVTSPQTYLSNTPTSVDIQFGSNLGNLGFEGTVTPQEPLDLSGRFQANIPRIGAIPAFFGVQLPVNLEPLGGLRTRGSLAGPLPELTVNFDELALSGDGLNAGFDGNLMLGASPEMSGNVNLSLRDAYALSDQLGLEMNTLKPIKQVSLVSSLSGPLTGLSFKGMDARTSSPILTATYKGDVSLAGNGSLKGDVAASTAQLGVILDQLGIATSENNELKNASISGQLDGTFISPGIRNGTYKLGNTEAAGSVSASMEKAVPRIQADIDMALLDLTPFLGRSKNNTARGNGWSDTQLDLQALNLLDADLQIRAETVNIGKITLRQANLDAVLTEGRLEAALGQFIAFGGDWQGETIVDASASQPSFVFSLSSNGVQAEQLLGTLGNFDQLSGSGRFSTDIRSTGMSIRELVNQVDGRMELSIDDGMLSGVNLGQLVRSASSLKEVLASGEKSITDFTNVVSPQAETDFSTFTTTLDIKDGIASVERFALINPVLSITGAGQIDLGGRTLDMRLTPAVDRSGQGDASPMQLNGIPIPLRVTGAWLSPRFSPDISGLQSALSERAAAKLGNQIGGELGSIISGGKEDMTGTDAQSESAQQDTQNREAEKDSTEQAVEDMLRSIFGPN